MMRARRPSGRLLALLFLAITLSGCQSFKELVTREKSNAAAPRELKPFKQKVEVETLWTKRIGKGTDEHYLKLAPAVIDDLLFAADRYGRLTASNLDDGNKVWEIEDDGVQYTGGPGGGDGMVLVGTGDGRVIARESASGKLRWVAKLTSEVLAAPRASGGVTVVRTGDGKLFGLDSANGKQLWVFDRTVPTLTLRGIGAPVIDEDLVLAGFDNGRLVAVNLRTGKLAWDSALAVPSGRSDLERMVDVDAEPVVVGTTVFVASFQGGVAALSVVDGQLIWSREISSYDELSVGDGRVYVTDETSALWALDAETGASLWKQEKLTNRLVNGPRFFGGFVVVGDYDGWLHWIDAATGKFAYREQIDDEVRIIAQAIPAGDRLLCYSSEGHLVAMRPR